MPMSTFRLLTLLVLLLVLLPSNPGAAQEPETVLIGTTDFPRSLDPASALDAPSWELLSHLYTGLTRQVPGMLTYELALATDHMISADGLTHTFTVRPDATFADGTPITATTFVESINRVLRLGRDAGTFLSQYIAAVSAGAPNTVQFTLRTPLPDFEALAALPPFFPQHPGDFPAEDVLPDGETIQIVGNGPYCLEAFRARQEAVLVPNDDFTPGTSPATRRIVLRQYTQPIELRRAMLAHEIDVAWRGLSLPDLEAIGRETGIIVQTQPNLQIYYLLFHHDQEPFDNPAVREAFALLINRERGAENGFDGTVTPLYSLIPPQFSAAEPIFPPFNPVNADAVLQAAGYRPRRRPLNVGLYISSTTYGALMIDAAQELTRAIEESEIVDITGIQDDQTATFVRAVSRGEYLNAIIGWRPPFASPAAYLIPLAASGSSIPTGNESGNAEVDALLQAAALSTDPAERDDFYRQVQTLLAGHFTLIPLWQGQDVIAFWNNVSGVIVETNSWLRYDSLGR